jgi:HEAT repeat protein
MGEKAGPAKNALLAALEDDAPDVRMTAAEALCGLGAVDSALPVLVDLLHHESRIIQNETLLAFCRIGEPAKAALPHLESLSQQERDKQSVPWSYDNVPDAAALARSCLGGAPLQGPAGTPRGTAPAVLRGAGTKASRQKYLP